MRNNNGPKIYTCGTPGFTLAQTKTCPLSKTLCLLLLKKSIIFKRSLEMPFYSSLKINPSSQTLPKALDISKKTLLTSSSTPTDL